uniref:Demethylmenaquinone methyltransferase n=1 Tax=Anthurium amnicola TaxID=1678845 RepID=A0A1D1YLI9_9ARAE
MGAHQSKSRKHHSPKEKRLPINSVSTESYASRDTNANPMYKVIDGRRYLVSNKAIYNLPIDDAEVDRLHLQHYTYRYYYGSNCSAPVEEMLKQGRARVLDVGCGAATWLLEMATEYPTCFFTGIDISPMFPAEIKPKNVHFIQRNAIDGLPFPDGTFDFVFMRMMYLSFTADQWENVIVRELSRVLKPGGWIELMECDQSLTDMGPLTTDYADKASGLLEELGIPTNLTELIPDYIDTVGCFEELTAEPREIPIGTWGGNLSQMYLDNVAAAYQTLRTSVNRYNISAEKWDEITQEVKREINERNCSVRSTRFYAQKKDTGKLMSLK